MAWMLTRLFLRKKHLQAVKNSGAYMNLKRAGRALVYLFNLHTLMLLAAACLSIYICSENGWSFNMDFSMISTGTVFPLTFTLAQAFTRRERATALIAGIKASVVGLYYMHRDWDQTNGYPSSLGNDELPSAIAAKTVLMELLISLRRYLVSSGPFESMAEARLTADRHEFLSLFEHDLHLSEKSKLFRSTVRSLMQQDAAQVHLRDCYKWLSRLSVLNEKLTLAAGYTRGGEGGLSRTNQYLRYIMANIEELRSIKEYRTPTMMRHACGVLFHIFAIVLAPYFVHYCTDPEQECAAGYASASAYVMIVMLLFHVQQDLENCFSETGLDDAFFYVAEEVDGLTGNSLLRSARSSMSDMTQWVHGHTPVRYGSLELPSSALGVGAGGGSPPGGMVTSAFANHASLSFSHSHEKLPALRTIPESGKAHDVDEHTPLTRPRSSDGGGTGVGGSSSAIPAGWGRPTLYAAAYQQAGLQPQGSSGGGAGYNGGSPLKSRSKSGRLNGTPVISTAAAPASKPQLPASPPAASPAGSPAGSGSLIPRLSKGEISPDLQPVGAECGAGRPCTPPPHCIITCPPTCPPTALGAPGASPSGSAQRATSPGPTTTSSSPMPNGHSAQSSVESHGSDGVAVDWPLGGLECSTAPQPHLSTAGGAAAVACAASPAARSAESPEHGNSTSASPS